MQILENVSLAPLTTLKVGGPARYLAEARTAEDVRDAGLLVREAQRALERLGGEEDGVQLRTVAERRAHHVAVEDIGCEERRSDERGLEVLRVFDAYRGEAGCPPDTSDPASHETIPLKDDGSQRSLDRTRNR